MGSPAGLILLVVALLLVLLFLSRLRRQQRAFAQEQNSFAEVQASLKPGQAVMTTSGVHGTVVSADDEATVVLEIAPGVHTRWARPAIAQIFDRSADDDPPPAPAASGAPTVLDLTSGPSSGTSAGGAAPAPPPEAPEATEATEGHDPPAQNLNETTAR